VPELDINMTAEVTATTYDVLLQQNTSVTVGTRPKIISDELAHWQKKAEAAADKEAADNQKRIDDIDLAWQKTIDQVNQDVGDVKRDINAQIQWQQQFKQQVDDDINDYKDYIGNQVADLNKLNSVVTYSDSQITFKLPNGSVVGSIGAGGLYYQSTDGKVKTVVGANGDLIADRITGNLLTGTTIHGAEITGGTIDTLDYFRAKSGNGYTVISADNGLSTDSGIHARQWSRFDADVLVGGNLTVAGSRIYMNSSATSYIRMNPADGLLYFRGGTNFAHDYQISLKGV